MVVVEVLMVKGKIGYDLLYLHSGHGCDGNPAFRCQDSLNLNLMDCFGSTCRNCTWDPD